MTLKSLEEITIIIQSAEILSKVHGQIAAHIQPGIATRALDKLAETYIADHGATPSFKGFGGYPAALCTSVNDQVMHGLPSQYVLKEGDIISIDCGVCYKNYHSDAAFTYSVGNTNKELLNLLSATREALYKGIAQANTQNRIGDISYAIQCHVAEKGYKVVREYGGHGIGRKLHEGPYIPNFGRKGSGAKIKEGMVLAIEPMVNLGTDSIMRHPGKWALYTQDRQPSAHFEHTIAIVNSKPQILTTYRYIEEALQ